MKARYVNPFTDFGFKKIFGEEASKPMLIDFLTSLLPESKIVDLAFKDKEKLGRSDEDRKAIYDIYCETESGEKIIVELQKAKQKYFKDRTVYYASFPIQEQAERGDWNYQLKYVYCVGVLDFRFEDEHVGNGEVIHSIQLKDQNNQVFYDKLKFVYLEMPNFNKSEDELLTRLDKWLYFIKYLEDFQNIPDIFGDEIFKQAFETAEIANYSSEERDEYEQSLKNYRDLKGVIDNAFDEGIEKGKIEGKYEVAKSMKLAGETVAKIMLYTGLSEEEINELQKNMLQY